MQIKYNYKSSKIHCYPACVQKRKKAMLNLLKYQNTASSSSDDFFV